MLACIVGFFVLHEFFPESRKRDMKNSLSRLRPLQPFLISVAAVLWAIDGVWRRNIAQLPGISIVFYEHLFGSLMLLPWVISSLKKEKLSKYVLGVSFLVALFGGLLGTLFITKAFITAGASFSVVILVQKLQPLFAISSAYFLLKEKINKKYFQWAVLAIIAAYFVSFKNGQISFQTGMSAIYAAGFSFLAAFFWGISTTLGKMLLNKVSDLSATILRFYFATVIIFVAMNFMGQGVVITALGVNEISNLLIIAFSTGILAMWLYYKGFIVTQAKVATILELAFPFTGMFVDYFLYKTILAPSQYLAAAVLMFAMYRVGRLKA
ncbi:MAG: DMT family transporter [Patescibacteria group bacterium]